MSKCVSTTYNKCSHVSIPDFYTAWGSPHIFLVVIIIYLQRNLNFILFLFFRISSYPYSYLVVTVKNGFAMQRCHSKCVIVVTNVQIIKNNKLLVSIVTIIKYRASVLYLTTYLWNKCNLNNIIFPFIIGSLTTFPVPH